MTAHPPPGIPTATQIANKIIAKLFSTFLLIGACLVGLKIAIELGGPWGLGIFLFLLLAGMGVYYWSKEPPLKPSRVDEVIRAREMTLHRPCPHCGAANPREFRFCPHCGTEWLSSGT